MGAGQADKTATAERVQRANEFRLLAAHDVGDTLRIDCRNTGHQPQLGAGLKAILATAPANSAAPAGQRR